MEGDEVVARSDELSGPAGSSRADDVLTMAMRNPMRGGLWTVTPKRGAT